MQRPGARRYRTPVACLVGEEPAILLKQRRGRRGWRIHHRVRSQLSIRGKRSDHRAAAVEDGRELKEPGGAMLNIPAW